MINLIPESTNPEEYNKKATHPVQSWEWGEARKKMGLQVLRIGEYENTILKNVFQLTFHPLPHTNFKIGYLPRSVFPSEDVINYLTDYSKKHNIIFIKMEPYILKNELRSMNDDISHLASGNFNLKISPHPLFTQWTMMVDLTLSEEELMKNLKSKTRYNIRLAEKKGVTVKEESTEEGFKKFSQLYFDTCKRQQYHGHTPYYHQVIWEHLKSNMAHILIAYYQGIPLTAYELFYFNKRFYYPYGGSSELHRNVMAANLLMWEAIKLGKKLGAEKFDLWGSLAPDYNHNNPWAGFTRFKEGYNAEFVQMADSYDLVIKPSLYTIYNLLHKARTIILKIQ